MFEVNKTNMMEQRGSTDQLWFNAWIILNALLIIPTQ